jgi:hypothetical protein
MPTFGPIRHRELVTVLRRLGWQGPSAGSKHLFMQKGSAVLTLPNPHRGDIGVKCWHSC